MGQTLTHGVYLPDEGERNCYSGLAANWQILDNSVGTIAEHTTQIAGKAPLVHTHTKSDITDLFNSANTWTGDNTYTAIISYQTSYTLGNPPQSAQVQQVIRAIDTAGTNYLAQIATYQDTAATGLRFTIRDKFDSNGFSPSGSNRNKHFYFVQNISNQGYFKWDGYIDNSISPLADNTYNLGNSSYKWKTLNGVNPGALSLPDNSGYTNISGNITDLTGAINSYTPPSDGYVMVNVNPNSNNYAFVSLERVTVRSSSETTSGKNAMATIPVIGGKSIDISVIGASIAQARFTPCLGNV